MYNTYNIYNAKLTGTMCLLIAVLLGCNDGPPTGPTALPAPTPTAAGDAISLGSITPSAGSVLRRGQAVTFSATLNYTLTNGGGPGIVAIVIQDQTNQNLKPRGETQPTVAVTQGTGTATLSDSVMIPDSGVSFVEVFFPLYSEGATRTDVVESVRYPVS